VNDLLARKRKFVLALLAWAGATAVVAVGKMDGVTYVTALAWILGLYGGANVAAKYVDKNGKAD
jgi:hypothetical protein